MPGGTIGGLTKGWQERTKNTSHWRYTSLTLMCTFKIVCSVMNFRALRSANFVLLQILSWYLQQLNQVEPFSQCGDS